MTVKILIERRFKEFPVQEIFSVFDELRVNALRQKGYISGETLINSEDKREMVVISTWSDFDDFNAWSNSPKRKELENKLTPYMERLATICSFKLGSDAIDEMFGKIIHDSEVEP